MDPHSITEKLHKEAEDEVRKAVRESFPKFPAYPCRGYEEADLWVTFEDITTRTKITRRLHQVLQAAQDALIEKRLPAAKDAKVTEFMEAVRNTRSRIDELEARQ